MAEDESLNRQRWVESILDRYEGPLIRYAARITGDDDVARDVVQETFLRLCAEERRNVDGRVAQWLYTVCRSRALDIRRKVKRMRTLNEPEPRASTRANDRTEAAAETLDPAVVAADREGQSRIVQAIGLLPKNQQEVIRLRFQGGLRYREIAAVTGLSATNVGYLIHTAIKTIREKLNATD